MKYTVKPHTDKFSSLTGAILIFFLIILTILLDNLNIISTN